MEFTIALAQIRVEPGCVDENISRAEGAISAAAAGGAALVVLPEALDCGWTHPSCEERAGAIPDGWACARLAEAARDARIHVCAGISERESDAIFNSAVLLGSDGSLLLHHRKLNELAIAHACYAQGNRLGVVRTPLGTIGVMICADAFVEGLVISRALAAMGADLIVSPCAWAVPEEHDNIREPYGALWRESYGPVASASALWIAGASNVGPITTGPWAGWKCIGCSLLVGPDGSPATIGPYGEEALLFAKISISPRARRDAEATRNRTH
jgi:predicted amidohydrolase